MEYLRQYILRKVVKVRIRTLRSKLISTSNYDKKVRYQFFEPIMILSFLVSPYRLQEAVQPESQIPILKLSYSYQT
jgi:hypothetical protein